MEKPENKKQKKNPRSNCGRFRDIVVSLITLNVAIKVMDKTSKVTNCQENNLGSFSKIINYLKKKLKSFYSNYF